MLLELSAPLARAVPVLAEAVMAVMPPGPSGASLEAVLVPAGPWSELALVPRLAAAAAGLRLVALILVLVIIGAVFCLVLFRLYRGGPWPPFF